MPDAHGVHAAAPAAAHAIADVSAAARATSDTAAAAIGAAAPPQVLLPNPSFFKKIEILGKYNNLSRRFHTFTINNANVALARTSPFHLG